jgi:predicted TIM-barrel fold metal-dependent hydrolase
MSVTLESLAGRVLDVDSHEQVPVPRWREVFGDIAQRFVDVNPMVFQAFEAMAEIEQRGDAPPSTASDVMVDEPDITEITPETVWELKGSTAPSSSDMTRRPQVLETMGIERALIFPTMALAAMGQALGGGLFSDLTSQENRDIAWSAVDAYNEWAGSLTRESDRLRMVGVLGSSRPEATAEWLAKEAERMIGLGLKAIMIPVGTPPAGLSPADPALDPFYATLAEANVALTTHPPGMLGYVSDAWARLPGVALAGLTSGAFENFVTWMTLGGVFERHPALRFGLIECGAQWLGPLAESLDFQAESTMMLDMPGALRPDLLPMKPSEYLARNVRVSGLLSIDDRLDVWLKRHPMIQDCYCYSSDYPHREGQPRSMEKFYDLIAPLGDDAVTKFFCDNARLLLP